MSKDKIKEIAIKMVREEGLINLSRKALCERAGIPDGSFFSVAGCTFSDLVTELVDEGVESAVCTSSKARTSKAVRKEHILTVAVEIAKERGYDHVERQIVAERAGVSKSLIGHYFRTMTNLKRDIMRFAIRKEIPSIIAQGLVNSDPHARKAPQELKEKAAKFLSDL